VLPIGSRVNERGRLEVGGCDLVELVEEHGTPAYIYAEDDLRARARAYREAFERRGVDGEVLFASKAFPATAAYRLQDGALTSTQLTARQPARPPVLIRVAAPELPEHLPGAPERGEPGPDGTRLLRVAGEHSDALLRRLLAGDAHIVEVRGESA